MDHKISGSVESWSNTYGTSTAESQESHSGLRGSETSARLDSTISACGPPEGKQTWRPRFDSYLELFG